MSSSLLLQQCPACLVRLTCIVFVMGGKCPYSWCLVGCCRQDLFKAMIYIYIYIYIYTHMHTHTYIRVCMYVCIFTYYFTVNMIRASRLCIGTYSEYGKLVLLTKALYTEVFPLKSIADKFRVLKIKQKNKNKIKITDLGRERNKNNKTSSR